jgi:hypothetical protein
VPSRVEASPTGGAVRAGVSAEEGLGAVRPHSSFTQHRCACHLHDTEGGECRDLRQNNISGFLPEQWAQPPAVPDLTDLNLAGNQLTGLLPSSWGAPGSFLQLVNLCAATLNYTLMLGACFPAS